ncbi:hypothetical protein RB195_023947 [Necator americanus]
MSLSLLIHDVLTKSFGTPPIREEDVKFIRKLILPIKLTREKSTVQPLALLGCDQLWLLIRDDQSQLHLPSGLHLLPSRLGHLLTGQLHRPLNESNNQDELDKWKGYWTLDGQANVVSS